MADNFIITFDDFCAPRGPDKRCDRCGEWWPPSHLDTDSGDCITCEEMSDEE